MTLANRCLSALLAAILLAACRSVPDTRSDSQAGTPGQAAAGVVDSVADFLLTAAATDFHTHRPPDPARFRGVHLGHLVDSTGQAQYRLCGQFLPAGKEAGAEWVPFATIKTSGYEQWIGSQAAGFCQVPPLAWDTVGDLSAALQARIDSIR